MTSQQIAALWALYPLPQGGTDEGVNVKYVSTGSGRTFSVNGSPGNPGVYSLSMDNTNDFLILTPRVAAAQNPNVYPATEYIPYDSVEMIGFFPT